MARITLRQLLDHAALERPWCTSFQHQQREQLVAIIQAAQSVEAPVILQVTRGARSYSSDAMIRHMIQAAEEMFPKTPICLHQDHGNNTTTCFSAIQNGFTSVMMDGSLEEDAKTPLFLRI